MYTIFNIVELDGEKFAVTYHTDGLLKGWMEAQRLTNDAVQVWKAVNKIVIGWVGIAGIFGHLFAETGLLFGVPRKLDDYPLKRMCKKLDCPVIKMTL